MALLPTGSDKLLEIRTSDIDLVIKSKNIQTAVAACADEQSSSVAITTFGLERIKVGIQNIDLNFENSGNYSAQIINVAPLFFEQTDYELIVNSRNGKAVHFWNENYLIREKIGPVIEGNNTLVTGIINFGNSVGYTDLEITADDRKVMVLRIEVYPSKITYKEDYQRMIADVSEMVYAAAIDFMQKTYQEFSIGDKQNNVPAIFFQIIFMIFEKYMNAAKRITTVPHHKLITERTVVPEYKAKRTDRKSEKWLMTHQRNIAMDQGGDLVVNRVLASRKQITYDTNENRFVKFILKATIRKLEDFITRYKKSVKNPEETVLLETNRMINKVRNILNTSFLREVSEYYAEQSMSLVFGMAPGYRELYKHYLMIQRGLSVHGDFFRISVKDTAQLYEHHFYKSIESVNIGGLPFLPGATSLVQKLLEELISDSKESAFERTTLPRGIEEKLAVVDWKKRDVLIGTFRSRKQFDICFGKNFYYIPVKQIPDERLPIHYVALYQTKNKFGIDAGIRYYGEVLRTAIVRRKNIKEIPLTHANAEELYYRFVIRRWDMLERVIEPKEHGFPCDYTNMFLLQHSEYIPELLIESEEKYRFYAELKRSVKHTEINKDADNIGFEYRDVHFIFTDGNILAIKEGRIVEKRAISDFARRPADTYRRLRMAITYPDMDV